MRQPRARLAKNSAAKPFALLLCGSGESGKTTYLRQLKLQFLPGGITPEDRQLLRSTIRGNLVETMQELLKWAEQHEMALSDDILETAELVTETNAFSDDELSPALIEALEVLWNEEVVQTAFQHRDETVIPDNMDYFFDSLDRVCCDNYTPTDEDILRARVRSMGIENVTFHIQGTPIRMYDVGGQQKERPKWSQIMPDVSGAVFCVSLADFDRPMREALPAIRPRVFDALEMFNTTVHQEKFLSAPVFLICTKFDRFSEKVTTTDCFQRMFPKYREDPHDPDGCADYLADMFVRSADPQRPERPITVYWQDSLNSPSVRQNTNAMCRYIKDHYCEAA
jgi:GTPase SAR1 family protein